MVGEAAKWLKTVWEGPKWSRRAQNVWDIFERQKWLPNGSKQSGRAQNGLGGSKMSGTLFAVYARVYGPHVPGAKCQVSCGFGIWGFGFWNVCLWGVGFGFWVVWFGFSWFWNLGFCF